MLLHRPPYSSGLYRGSPALRSALEALLLHRKVALVLAGHDHHVKGLTHLVTGGGGAWPRPVPLRRPESQKVHAGPHFVVLTVEGQRLKGEARDPDLTLLDRFSLDSP